MTHYVTGSKLVTLVDEQGKAVGGEDVFKAHQYPLQLHSAASVWIFNQGQVLLQQRSIKKITAANWWANTICGNVKPDESPQECAYRRLKEELNFPIDFISITSSYSFVYKAYINQEFGEYEFDHVFIGTLTDASAPLPQPNPEEVQATVWVDFAELKNWALALDFPSTTQSLTLSDEELKQQTKPQPFTFEGNSYQIGPWTIFMLRDERLVDNSTNTSASPSKAETK
jgi:isopentenyl-diphosphate delta-isomerase